MPSPPPILFLLLGPTALALALAATATASRVSRPCLRSGWLLVATALMRPAALVVGLPPSAAIRVATLAGDALLIGFCGANWQRRSDAFRVGLALLVSGAALNSVPTLWAGAMPYSAVAAATSGLSAAEIAAPPTGHVALVGEPGIIASLSDVIAVPSLHGVASPGDLVLIVGATTLVGCVLPRIRGRRAVRVRA